jgi:dihydrofolate reductase
MGTIGVHEFISLDGVIESPSWTVDYPFDPKMGEAIGKIMTPSKAILLGRNTYEMFEPAWSTRTADDDPGTPFMNDTQKYVVSSTLENTTWRNSTILGPYDAKVLRDFKDSIDSSIYVSGSARLVQGMLADGLVDELHLFVFPVSLGSGQRLFEGSAASTKLTLAGCESYSSGVVHLTYTPA